MDAAAHNKESDYLRLLSIFHYVLAALQALGACMPFIHVAIGIGIIAGGADVGGRHLPVFVGLMFVLIGGFIILVGWTFAVCLFLSGCYLRERRNYNFSLIFAGFCCILFPLGTVLGVFTILVLLRPGVKELYEGRARNSGAAPLFE